VGETAEVIRLVFERLNARDARGFAELCSPRIELHDIPEIPGARTHRGPDEAEAWARDLFEVSDEVKWANWEMRERGEAALIDTSVDIRSNSGMDLGWRAWTVWRVREGLLAYYAGYSERDQALADLDA
jgi:hypothetical protein